MPVYSKTCQKCLECKSIKRFAPDPLTKDKLDLYCEDCRTKYPKGDKSIQKEMPRVKSAPKRGKRILQIDKETDNIIDIHDSPKAAGEKIGKNPMSIRRVLRLGKGIAHGFKWEFEKIVENNREKVC